MYHIMRSTVWSKLLSLSLEKLDLIKIIKY